MGGVDLMGRYHIRAKTNNVMMRIFYHLIDMAATNAYILYNRMHKVNDSSNNSTEKVKLLELPQFRERIAEGLVAYVKRQPGRPSTPAELPPNVNKKGRKAVHPTDEVRYDLSRGHLNTWLPNQGGKRLCKLCKNSQTQSICSTCDLHLCNKPGKNCHWEYHHQQQ